MIASSPLEIQAWHIERFVLYARNPRKNDAVVDRMCSSIREYGFKIPVLARSDGEVIDGHLRIKAARKLRIDQIPVILCDEWTPAQAHQLSEALEGVHLDVIYSSTLSRSRDTAIIVAAGRHVESMP